MNILLKMNQLFRLKVNRVIGYVVVDIEIMEMGLNNNSKHLMIYKQAIRF